MFEVPTRLHCLDADLSPDIRTCPTSRITTSELELSTKKSQSIDNNAAYRQARQAGIRNRLSGRFSRTCVAPAFTDEKKSRSDIKFVNQVPCSKE
jgi:hypothetical protein